MLQHTALAPVNPFLLTVFLAFAAVVAAAVAVACSCC